jgi:hypothetical protein
MITIGFFTTGLSYRGTEVACFDYAHFNETLLGNKSIILTIPYENVKTNKDYTPMAYDRFQNRFALEYYSSVERIDEIQAIIDRNKITHLYHLKSGEIVMPQLLKLTGIKYLVHCVFSMRQPHGNSYFAISDWVANNTRNPGDLTNYQVVPHIMHFSLHSDEIAAIDDLRMNLNIPKNAVVFGRHGGGDSFDIPWVKELIVNIAEKFPDKYFLFLGTDRFSSPELKNIIYLERTTDIHRKIAFIKTCDFMIHARWRGETFGMACAEFSYLNVPIITFGGSPERNHLDVLGHNCFIYNESVKLAEYLLTLNKNIRLTKNWDMFRKFTPEYVMRLFQRAIHYS